MSDPTVIQTKVFAAIIELLGEKSLSIADKTRLIDDGGVLDSMKLDQSQARLPSGMPLMLKMMRKLKTEELANKLGFDRLAFLKQMNLVPKRLAYHPPLRRKNKQAQSTNRNM